MSVKGLTSRQLAKIFGYNLARWKRWSREFLPPDPRAGLQDGFTREFSLDEAWTVFVGGHLVATLKFTIPQAKIILSDIRPWMRANGLFPEPPYVTEFPEYSIWLWEINILPGIKRPFYYEAIGIITWEEEDLNQGPAKLVTENYIKTPILKEDEPAEAAEAREKRVLMIEGLLQVFMHGCCGKDAIRARSAAKGTVSSVTQV
jgi:hypothetical protein